ncbi:MAG: capsule assembly Wzi family protein [Muribaculaceae bacterium]|nr:capsule assembly Wzi family protein [Muribaculaceae bacterium]
MKINSFIKIALAVIVSMTAGNSFAQYKLTGEAELIFNAGSHSLAPYYMSALNHGILSQSKGTLLKAGLFRPMEIDRRFSYSFGAQFITGITSKADYDRYLIDEGWVKNPQRPAPIWLQQLYGEIKYRCLFLSIGMKERGSVFVNNSLSSGDVMHSGNARPIPQVRAGFLDFQNIPFTNGWLQIAGEMTYGKFVQNNFLKDHTNYFGGSINLGTIYHYKYGYLRTKPTKPFWAVVGVQVACLFGGETYYYYHGKQSGFTKNRENLSAFWQAFFPRDNGYEGWYEGQSLGSWDFKFNYRIRSGAVFSAYYQNLWEDGSSMAKLNGFDGLWGIEYKAPNKGIVSGAVVEYIDFTNQCGPVNYNDNGYDYPGTTLTGYNVTGVDNYYNNGFYNSYANYGFSLGTPFSKEPIYNLDGSLNFNNNRVRGFHAAVEGTITNEIDYRVLGGYRISYGTYSSPALTPRTDTSFMIEAIYSPARIQGLKFKGQFALDHGELFGNLTGACVSVAYSGNFSLKFKK